MITISDTQAQIRERIFRDVEGYDVLRPRELMDLVRLAYRRFSEAEKREFIQMAALEVVPGLPFKVTLP